MCGRCHVMAFFFWNAKLILNYFILRMHPHSICKSFRDIVGWFFQLLLYSSCFFFFVCSISAVGTLYQLTHWLTDRRGMTVVHVQMKCWMTFLRCSNCGELRRGGGSCRVKLAVLPLFNRHFSYARHTPFPSLPQFFVSCLISTFPQHCLSPHATWQKHTFSSNELLQWLIFTICTKQEGITCIILCWLHI